MTDREAIEALIAAKGTPTGAAASMGVSKQRFHHWKREGIISPEGRPLVWLALRKIGKRLPANWLKAQRIAA